jgi:hypothetical protein
MPLIPFPVVPILPGVPNIPRLISSVIPPVALAAAGTVLAILGSALQSPTRWGIFDSTGKPLINTSGISLLSSGPVLSTFSVDYSKELRVSDFPVEKGGFASYNKVELPGAPAVTLCLSGSAANRKAFLNAVDAAAKSTNLYSVVTPEVTYINHTIERYNYQRRSSHGATLLSVDIFLKEVRQVSAQYTTASTSPINSPQNPGATPTENTGQVQGTTPPDTSPLNDMFGSKPSIQQQAPASPPAAGISA